MTKLEITFVVVLALVLLNFLFDLELIAVIRDLLKRKESE